MFQTLKHFFGIEPKEKTATISSNNFLYSPDGEFVASYSRRRDAIRGARRRGFKVA